MLPIIGKNHFANSIVHLTNSLITLLNKLSLKLMNRINKREARYRDMAKTAKKFKFGRHATLGAIAAAQDPFLEECFVDRGDIDFLTDFDDHRCIIVGRTGAGKSALIEWLNKNKSEKVISIDPHELSLSFIANNNVLKSFEEAGVSLTPFYRVLWKHVFVTEIVRRHYRIKNEAGNESFLRQLTEFVRRDKVKEEAVAYFREWGDKFFETTEVRIKQMTQKVTQQLETAAGASAKMNLPNGQAGFDISHKKSGEVVDEQASEVTQRGQRVMDDIQITNLTRVIELLGERILDDPQKVYYITIDKLDEDWVEDAIRYQLIFELMSVAYELNNKLKYRVKVIIGLREDLLQRVYDFVRNVKAVQFQQEKYEDGYLKLTWSVKDLEILLQKRIRHLYVKKYTTEEITLEDIFSPQIVLESTLPGKDKKRTPLNYILEQTTLTPRDAIRYFNRCIEVVRDNSTGTFTKTAILNAAPLFSEDRLHALIDEWRVNFPNIAQVFALLRNQPANFKIPEIVDSLHSKIDEVFPNLQVQVCPIYILFDRVYAPEPHGLELTEMLAELCSIFFTVGAVGIELHNNSMLYWGFKENRITSENFRDPESRVYIHPSLYYALAIKVKQ